jgi:hypothetical protein
MEVHQEYEAVQHLLGLRSMRRDSTLMETQVRVGGRSYTYVPPPPTRPALGAHAMIQGRKSTNIRNYAPVIPAFAGMTGEQ